MPSSKSRTSQSCSCWEQSFKLMLRTPNETMGTWNIVNFGCYPSTQHQSFCWKSLLPSSSLFHKSVMGAEYHISNRRCCFHSNEISRSAYPNPLFEPWSGSLKSGRGRWGMSSLTPSFPCLKVTQTIAWQMQEPKRGTWLNECAELL